jgi:hypothetical protein
MRTKKTAHAASDNLVFFDYPAMALLRRLAKALPIVIGKSSEQALGGSSLPAQKGATISLAGHDHQV